MMFEENPYFAENGIELVPIAAEDVLSRRSKHYGNWAIALDATDEMEHRLEMEEKGIQQLKSGKYKPLSS